MKGACSNNSIIKIDDTVEPDAYKVKFEGAAKWSLFYGCISLLLLFKNNYRYERF